MKILNLSGVVILILSLGGFSHAGRMAISFRGTIVAYRPAERAMQVASHVLNKEEFLFRVEGPKSLTVKLVYEHFGYTTLNDEILAASPFFLVQGHRDPSCDETIAAFVENSPLLRNEASKSDSVESIVFVGTKPSGSQLLKCYRVEGGGLQVENPAPGQ